MMAEVLSVMLMLACAVAITPFLWEVCDRGAARHRLDLRHAVTGDAPAPDADLVTFLTAIARAVRSGSSSARAVMTAPPTCAETADVQRQLAAGRSFGASTAGDHPHVRLLRACANGDSLSVTAIERAIADERFRVRTRHDIAVAVAQASRSARILTVLPFVMVLLAVTFSGTVRRHMFSPVAITAVSVGIALNLAGRVWTMRLVTEASRPSPPLQLASDIASVVALHLCAGASVTDGFVALAGRDPRCAEVAVLLAAGHMMSDALRPIEDVAPQVVRTVIDAHRDGLPLNDTMLRLADDLREASSSHIQSRIAQVAVRGTTPLVLCTLPSFLLIGIVPVALAALSGLSTPTL